MFSVGAAAPFTFWDEIRILALSLAFFRVSFVRSLPWFSGLVLGIGWVRSFQVPGACWVPCGVATWACALVGFTWFGALSGMDMHGWRCGSWGACRSIYLLRVRREDSAMYMLRV